MPLVPPLSEVALVRMTQSPVHQVALARSSRRPAELRACGPTARTNGDATEHRNSVLRGCGAVAVDRGMPERLRHDRGVPAFGQRDDGFTPGNGWPRMAANAMVSSQRVKVSPMRWCDTVDVVLAINARHGFASVSTGY